jgi:hypothetical protein
MIPANVDPQLLTAAVEAARRALRRIDDKDIPARLRDIAGRSGRLPAPFAKRLLTELDASDWLRAEALLEIDAESGDGSDGDTASVLFLERPEDWVERMESLAVGHREAVERSQIKRLETDLANAIARSGRLEKRLASAERREQEAVSGVEERLAAAAAAHRRSQAQLKSARDRLAARLSSSEEEVGRLTGENSSLLKKLAEARSDKEKSYPPVTPDRVQPAWSLGKPIEIARHLDDINRALKIAPTRSTTSRQMPEPTRLTGPPAGIRPDRAEAMVWLVGLPDRISVAIDGWNAAHLLQSPPTPATRNRIIEAGRRIALASSGKRRVTTVFDSSQLGESFSADEVAVTFVASADEELIDMAGRDPDGLVVITSDRRVREAVERAGAVGLWSEALIDWLKTGGRRTFRG